MGRNIVGGKSCEVPFEDYLSDAVETSDNTMRRMMEKGAARLI
jgi:hypothetical protein